MNAPSDCATASAEIGRGLNKVADAVLDLREMLIPMHEAMTKEPAPSKIPEALAKLTAAVEAQTAEILALRTAVKECVRQ